MAASEVWASGSETAVRVRRGRMKRRGSEMKAEWMASNMEATRQRRRAALAKRSKILERFRGNTNNFLKVLIRG